VLIADLLALSRVGRTTERFEQIDLDRKLDQALGALSVAIEETGARIERLTPLPIVDGDRALLISLLQNLIGNAIKFRGEDQPRVDIGVSRDGDMYTFTISDNGIGIAPRYADRIFVIFQRLHPKEEYTGTGIGLAMCRKIVEFHGGQIWLDGGTEGAEGSAPDDGTVSETPTHGATFHFTLPVPTDDDNDDETSAA
jgi:light-regulated signal transduction histidine kinase (bacteriophytochrome)